MRTRWIVLPLLFLAATLQAGKGGHGGGGGGGGTPPPADPAIVFGQAGDLMVMDADGANVTDLYSGAGNPRASWSPDGTQIVFVGGPQAPEGRGIYVVDADGSGLTKIVSTTLGPSRPVWSPVPTPDGSYRILFNDDPGTSPDGNWDIFAVDPDGTNLVNLTNTVDRSEDSPTWSPGADRFAADVSYLNDAGTKWLSHVYVFALDASGAISSETNVTDGSVLENTVASSAIWVTWSKTQDVLACSAMLAGTQDDDLWVIDLADPGNPVRLTDTSDVEERAPTWSSDDSQIAFQRYAYTKKSVTGIYTIAPDGSGLTALYTINGWKGPPHDPSWKR